MQVLCGWAHPAEVECLRNQGARHHDEPMYYRCVQEACEGGVSYYGGQAGCFDFLSVTLLL